MGILSHEDPLTLGEQIDGKIRSIEDRIGKLERALKEKEEVKKVDKEPTPQHKIAAAIKTICKYGPEDGAHHKDWVLQEVYKILLGLNETRLLCQLEDLEWERGTPP